MSMPISLRIASPTTGERIRHEGSFIPHTVTRTHTFNRITKTTVANLALEKQRIEDLLSYHPSASAIVPSGHAKPSSSPSPSSSVLQLLKRRRRALYVCTSIASGVPNPRPICKMMPVKYVVQQQPRNETQLKTGSPASFFLSHSAGECDAGSLFTMCALYTQPERNRNVIYYSYVLCSPFSWLCRRAIDFFCSSASSHILLLV